MGTNCYIGVQNEDGSVTYSYCHYDGYPDGVGERLVDLSYLQACKVAGHGDMNCLLVDDVGPHPEPLPGGHRICFVAADVADYKATIARGNVEYGYLLNAVGDRLFCAARDGSTGSWKDLRKVLGLPPKECKIEPDPGRVDPTGGNQPMQTNEITGFRVRKFNEFFVDTNASGNFSTYVDPKPIPRGDAFRRLAAWLDQNPGEDHDDYAVEAVFRETTPIEDAAHELGGLFESLCQRHGLDLGLNRQQIDALLVKDLEQVKNIGSIAGIPGVRR